MESDPAGSSTATAAPRPRVVRDIATSVAGLGLLLTVAATVAGCQWFLVGREPGGPRAIALACAATLPGALVGWSVARLPFSSPAMGAAFGLAGVVMRMGLPLIGLAWFTANPPRPGSVAPATLLVGAYLVLLATDVGMHVILRKQGLSPPSDRPQARRSRVGD